MVIFSNCFNCSILKYYIRNVYNPHIIPIGAIEKEAKNLIRSLLASSFDPLAQRRNVSGRCSNETNVIFSNIR